MPYASSVSVLCGKNVAKKIVSLPNILDARIKKRSDGLFRIYWPWILWEPDSYDVIRKMDRTIKSFAEKRIADDADDDFCSFIRIGEDSGDIEQIRNNDCMERQWVGSYIDAGCEDTAVKCGGSDFATKEFAMLMFKKGEW